MPTYTHLPLATPFDADHGALDNPLGVLTIGPVEDDELPAGTLRVFAYDGSDDTYVVGYVLPSQIDALRAALGPAPAPTVTDEMIAAFGDAWTATPPGKPGDRRRAGIAAVLALCTQ